MKAKYTRRTLQSVLVASIGALLIPNQKVGILVLIAIIATFTLIATIKELKERGK